MTRILRDCEYAPKLGYGFDEEFDGVEWGRGMYGDNKWIYGYGEPFAGHKAYCVTCRGIVHTMSATCPFCRKLIWELMATEPFDYEHKLRTTRATYAGAFESEAGRE